MAGSAARTLLDANVEREARGLVVQGHSTVRTFGEDGATLGTGLRVHVAAFAQPPRMVIFGAIDFSAALAPLARRVGYRVTIADPRRAFLASPRFSAFADTVAAWPDAVLDGVELGPARRRARLHPRPEARRAGACRRRCRTGAGYVGALGSRNTTEDRNARLREAGVDDEGIARVFAPCGLDIGASTVEETAVAVLARSSPTAPGAGAARCARPPGRSGGGGRRRRRRIRRVTDRLYFTDSDEANALIAQDPFALLVGFVLDQQVPVPKAFSGPLVLRERLGTLDAGAVAAADLDPIFRERPAIHRFPGAMAGRVQAMAAHVEARYDGDAARVWTDAATPEELKANLEALPGFGEMKVKALAAVLAKRFGVEVAAPLVPDHPTLGDVDSAEALLRYQAAKRAYKTGGSWDPAATVAS